MEVDMTLKSATKFILAELGFKTEEQGQKVTDQFQRRGTQNYSADCV